MYYAIYEEAKQAFGANEDDRHHPVATAAAGAIATAAGDAVNLPLDVVKQRLQVHTSNANWSVQCHRRLRVTWIVIVSGAILSVSEDAAMCIVRALAWSATGTHLLRVHRGELSVAIPCGDLSYQTKCTLV